MSAELGPVATTFDTATSSSAKVPESPFQGNSPHQLADSIAIFVGSTRAFPDPIMRSFGAEMSDIRAVRLPDLAQLHMFIHLHGIPPFVIFEQGYADDLTGEAARQFQHLNQQSHLILAYDDPAIAQQTMVHQETDPTLPELGYLPMQRPLAVWLAVSRLLMCGESYIPPELLGMTHVEAPSATPVAVAPVERFTAVPPAAQDKVEPAVAPTEPETSPLTPREEEVLAMVAQGKPNKVIANEISVSPHTVKLHIHNVISKLSVPNRTAASAWFLARQALNTLDDSSD